MKVYTLLNLNTWCWKQLTAFAIKIVHYELVTCYVLYTVTSVSVKLAGWDCTVSRRRMSASLIRARMVVPA